MMLLGRNGDPVGCDGQLAVCLREACRGAVLVPLEDALGEDLGELLVEDRMAGVKIEILSSLRDFEAGSAHADGHGANVPAAGGTHGSEVGCNGHDEYCEDKGVDGWSYVGGVAWMCFMSSLWVGDEESTTKERVRQSLKVDGYSSIPMTEVIECGI